MTGSGNVFADLGLDDPEELLLKAQLGVEISQAIEKKGLTAPQAASKLALSEMELSVLLISPLSLTTGRLLGLLNKLDQEVTVVVTPRQPNRPSSASPGREQTAA